MSHRRIGIWDYVQKTGYYERQPGTWPSWADVPSFPARGEKRRVLLLGESVARGFFYDPVLTPALLMEKCLQVVGADQFEVIDLARVGARSHDLLEIAEAAADLKPEAVVVFAGNNWKYELTNGVTPSVRRAEGDALIQGGVAGILRHRENRLADISESFARRMCGIFGEQAHMMFVLPESNLIDWHPEPLVPTLGGGRDALFRSLTRDLERAIVVGDDDAVLRCCESLIDLSDGVSDVAYRCKADAELRLGRVDDALADYRRARDARLWYDIADLAWLPSVGAVGAQRAAVEAKAMVVDLSEILPAYADSGVPDRSLFLDACHMSSRGIKIVTAEVVARLGDVLGFSASIGDCAAVLPDVEAKIESSAQFCAAVAQAEFGQPAASIARHAQAAAKVDPAIVDGMEAYCNAPASRTPWWIRPREFSGAENMRRFVHGFGFVGRYRYNYPLFSAFAEVIRQTRGDSYRSGEVRRDRALVPGSPTEIIDTLFAPSWSPAGWDGIFDVHDAQRRYYRAYSDTTKFQFALAEPASLALEITARLGAASAAVAEVLLNDRHCGRIVLGPQWKCARLLIDPGVLIVGLNRLEIQWLPESIDGVPFQTIVDRIARGFPQELGVVFGEIFTMRATAVPRMPTEI